MPIFFFVSFFSPLFFQVNTKSGLIAFLIDASGERNGPENDAIISSHFFGLLLVSINPQNETS